MHMTAKVALYCRLAQVAEMWWQQLSSSRLLQTAKCSEANKERATCGSSQPDKQAQSLSRQQAPQGSEAAQYPAHLRPLLGHNLEHQRENQGLDCIYPYLP